MSSFPLPAAVRAMARRGPDWADWMGGLPATVAVIIRDWELRPDGDSTCGHCSLVIPVRTARGEAAVLKIGFPDEESEHEHLALRRWGGVGAVRLLSADPRHRALLLDRLCATDLTSVTDAEACLVVAGLYTQLHVRALPSLRHLSSFLDRWNADLASLLRAAPIPRRLVEQALALGRDLSADRAMADRVIHTDLHYANVLAGPAGRRCGPLAGRGGVRQSSPAGEQAPWLAIDPKPVNGDPHYEVAPMLWNRWDEIAGDVRGGVRRRFRTLVEAAGFDEERARAWVVVRMVHNAMWAVTDGPEVDRRWLTTCIAVAKAVLD